MFENAPIIRLETYGATHDGQGSGVGKRGETMQRVRPNRSSSRAPGNQHAGISWLVQTFLRRACFGATVDALRGAAPVSGALDVSKGERAAVAEAFRGFKGDVDNLLALFAGEARYDSGATAYYHPGRSARALINGAVVAEFGQIDPEVAAVRKLRQDVFVAEIDLEQLYDIGLRVVKFTPLGKYPAVERDFSFVFDDKVLFSEINKAATNLGIAELREFQPEEIFRGGAIPAGKYSVLLRVRLQSAERTLRDDEIAQWSVKIVGALTKLGGVQRV